VPLGADAGKLERTRRWLSRCGAWLKHRRRQLGDLGLHGHIITNLALAAIPRSRVCSQRAKHVAPWADLKYWMRLVHALGSIAVVAVVAMITWQWNLRALPVGQCMFSSESAVKCLLNLGLFRRVDGVLWSFS